MTARKDGLMRIFWPSDAPRDDIPGVLVGWRNSEQDVLVVGVLQGVEVRDSTNVLRWSKLANLDYRLVMLTMLCACAHSFVAVHIQLIIF